MFDRAVALATICASLLPFAAQSCAKAFSGKDLSNFLSWSISDALSVIIPVLGLVGLAVTILWLLLTTYKRKTNQITAFDVTVVNTITQNNMDQNVAALFLAKEYMRSIRRLRPLVKKEHKAFHTGLILAIVSIALWAIGLGIQGPIQ